MFTFHIRNVGTNVLNLPLGCGDQRPIVLETPMGALSIGPTDEGICDESCEDVYGQSQPEFCTDCGDGVGIVVAAGATADIAWDRRVYQTRDADPSCVEGANNVQCDLPLTVAPTATQSGVVSLCPYSQFGLQGCSSAPALMFNFTVDTTAPAAVIDVM
jgi:hypothetical protein